MTTYVLIGIGGLLVAGLVWALVRLALRLGEKRAEKIIAEHSADVQRRMAEAEAGKPADADALIERLRNAGL